MEESKNSNSPSIMNLISLILLAVVIIVGSLYLLGDDDTISLDYEDQVLFDIMDSFSDIKQFKYWSMNNIGDHYNIKLVFDNNYKEMYGVTEYVIMGNTLDELITNLHTAEESLKE